MVRRLCRMATALLILTHLAPSSGGHPQHDRLTPGSDLRLTGRDLRQQNALGASGDFGLSSEAMSDVAFKSATTIVGNGHAIQSLR